MNTLRVLCLAAAVAAPGAALAAGNPFAGRWDLIVTPPDASGYPQWLEVTEQGSQLAVRVQPRGGAVRPAVEARRNGAALELTVQAANPRQGAITWVLTAQGDRLTGTQQTGGKDSAKIAGVRAPRLDAKPVRAWSTPEPLFNGRDLTGWEVIPGRKTSQWKAENHELVNETSGANLKTTRKFMDFRLHIEYNVPEHGNSGLYLRGRYEVQIGVDEPGHPEKAMGSLYGHYPASVELPLGLNEWQSYDVTLIGRRLTVVRNGVTIQDNVEIPGPTGGALDSNEGEPGPFFLQGDHQGRLRFRNITVSEPVR